jgi:hypothetical protein
MQKEHKEKYRSRVRRKCKARMGGEKITGEETQLFQTKTPSPQRL